MRQTITALASDLRRRAREFVEIARRGVERAKSRRSIQSVFNLGYCPICESATLFVETGDWLREDYLCARCRSLPRFRALVRTLEKQFPDWRRSKIHESSPSGASSEKLARECAQYVATQYFPNVPRGELHDGFQCEDLEQLTFADESFDLVVTQDVFEHVLDPARAFAEVARTLKPGGAHVFTVPMYPSATTLVRARREADGSVHHLAPPDYHGNPIDAKGSLVVREWGQDLPAFIQASSKMVTSIERARDRTRGIDGEFLEVLTSRKPLAEAKRAR